MKTFEEVYESLPSNGWLLESEARLLWDTALKCEGTILEVGCFEGRSTVLLASLGRHVNIVDCFDNHHCPDKLKTITTFRNNMESRGLTNYTLFPVKVEDWHIRGAGFCYLDGDHSALGTTKQILVATECLSLANQPITQTFQAIAVHDVNDTGGGKEVKMACLTLLGAWSKRVDRLAVWHF